MAWLERDENTNIYSVCFRLPKCFMQPGKRFKQSLKTTEPEVAERLKGRLEENIQLVERGRMAITAPHNAVIDRDIWALNAGDRIELFAS